VPVSKSNLKPTGAAAVAAAAAAKTAALAAAVKPAVAVTPAKTVTTTTSVKAPVLPGPPKPAAGPVKSAWGTSAARELVKSFPSSTSATTTVVAGSVATGASTSSNVAGGPRTFASILSGPGATPAVAPAGTTPTPTTNGKALSIPAPAGTAAAEDDVEGDTVDDEGDVSDGEGDIEPTTAATTIPVVATAPVATVPSTVSATTTPAAASVATEEDDVEEGDEQTEEGDEVEGDEATETEATPQPTSAPVAVAPVSAPVASVPTTTTDNINGADDNEGDEPADDEEGDDTSVAAVAPVPIAVSVPQPQPQQQPLQQVPLQPQSSAPTPLSTSSRLLANSVPIGGHIGSGGTTPLSSSHYSPFGPSPAIAPVAPGVLGIGAPIGRSSSYGSSKLESYAYAPGGYPGFDQSPMGGLGSGGIGAFGLGGLGSHVGSGPGIWGGPLGGGFGSSASSGGRAPIGANPFGGGPLVRDDYDRAFGGEQRSSAPPGFAPRASAEEFFPQSASRNSAPPGLSRPVAAVAPSRLPPGFGGSSGVGSGSSSGVGLGGSLGGFGAFGGGLFPSISSPVLSSSTNIEAKARFESAGNSTAPSPLLAASRAPGSGIVHHHGGLQQAPLPLAAVPPHRSSAVVAAAMAVNAIGGDLDSSEIAGFLDNDDVEPSTLSLSSLASGPPMASVPPPRRGAPSPLTSMGMGSAKVPVNVNNNIGDDDEYPAFIQWTSSYPAVKQSGLDTPQLGPD
jgi:hypothetical protein